MQIVDTAGWFSLHASADSEARVNRGGPFACNRFAPIGAISVAVELLLHRCDRVLCNLGHAELHHGLGLDLDGLTRLRVAAKTRLALCLYQLADTRNGELAILLGLFHCGLCQQFQETCGLLVGQFELLRQVANQRCLCHSLCHVLLLLTFDIESKVCSPCPHKVFVKRIQFCNAKSPMFMRVRRTVPQFTFSLSKRFVNSLSSVST